MARKKLTMYQIADRAASGEIPEGYYVKWLCNPPGRVFEDYASGPAVEISRESVPKPDGVVVKGAYVVDVERYTKWDFERETKVNFGLVGLWTKFVLDDLKFLYKAERKEELENYISNYMDMSGRFAMKKDYVFDVKYAAGDRKGMLMNAWIKDVVLPEDGEGMIEVNMFCDYINRYVD